MTLPHDNTYLSLLIQIENNDLDNLQYLIKNNIDKVDNNMLNRLIYQALNLNFRIAEWLMEFAITTDGYNINVHDGIIQRILEHGSDRMLDIAIPNMAEKDRFQYLEHRAKKWSQYLVLRKYDFVPTTIYSEEIYIDAPSLNDARDAAKSLGHNPVICDLVFAISHNQKEHVVSLVKENPDIALRGRNFFLYVAITRANPDIVEIFGLIHSTKNTSERVLGTVCECVC